MRSYDAYRDMITEALPRIFDGKPALPERLKEAMEYSLLAGGKRLRPVLLLAACDLKGGDLEKALPFACALEMIHTYSLIHDDLPAMDNDDLRRGRPTNHKVYGPGVATLAGDGLLNAAMELMLSEAVRTRDEGALLAAEAIARRAGITGMIAGQTEDVILEGTEPDADKVLFIHEHKTADLLTAPLEAGLRLAGASEEEVARGIRYGYHFGLAFQMVDDLLDVVGDAALMGKNTGMDARRGKMTQVACVGVDETRRIAAAHIEKACEAMRPFGAEGAFFTDLARATLNRVS